MDMNVDVNVEHKRCGRGSERGGDRETYEDSGAVLSAKPSRIDKILWL